MVRDIFSKRKVIITSLLILCIILTISSISYFISVNNKVIDLIGTGPESGITFLFKGIPKYFHVFILIALTIAFYAGTLIFTILSKTNMEK